MSEEQDPALVRARQRGFEWKKTREELRERFAMAALAGMLGNPILYGHKHDYAKWAYEYAEAMMKARNDVMKAREDNSQ